MKKPNRYMLLTLLTFILSVGITVDAVLASMLSAGIAVDAAEPNKKNKVPAGSRNVPVQSREKKKLPPLPVNISELFTATDFVKIQTVPKNYMPLLGGEEKRVDPFKIGKYEVTQGQWMAVMGSNPSFFKTCGNDCPVEQVSWNDVQEFLQKLNQKTGMNYRLPTLSEWSHACRSGMSYFQNQDRYCGGSYPDPIAWYNANSSSQTHPVGTKQANQIGVHDMSGNVWEWLQDSPQKLGSETPPSQEKIVAGGSWFWNAEDILYNGLPFDASYRSFIVGFRLVLPAD